MAIEIVSHHLCQSIPDLTSRVARHHVSSWVVPHRPRWQTPSFPGALGWELGLALSMNQPTVHHLLLPCDAVIPGCWSQCHGISEDTLNCPTEPSTLTLLVLISRVQAWAATYITTITSTVFHDRRTWQLLNSCGVGTCTDSHVRVRRSCARFSCLFPGK